MIVVQSESGSYPILLDTVSSKHTVYVRKNVKEVQKEDEDGTLRTWFKYDEEQWPKDEWQATHLPEMSEKVDLLMMMMLESEGIL